MAASPASCQRRAPLPVSSSAAWVPATAAGAAALWTLARTAAVVEAAASLYGGQGGASTGGDSLRTGWLPPLSSSLPLLLSAPSTDIRPAVSGLPSAPELPPPLLLMLSASLLPDDETSISESLGRKLSSSESLLRSPGRAALAAACAAGASAASVARRLPRRLPGLAASLSPEPAAAGWVVGLEPRAGLRSRDAARDSMKFACACTNTHTTSIPQ